MDRRKIKLLYHTLKYLKLKQIVFRIFYFIRKKFFPVKWDSRVNEGINVSLNWHNYEIKYPNTVSQQQFSFLNLSKDFEGEIDWNFSKYGKLWTYNLTYFDFLNQKDISVTESIQLINDFISKKNFLKDAIEPFPISLRGINWVKFLSREQIDDATIKKCLYEHYWLLTKNLEYHLLGNHLLENGFSLLFGAYFFKDDSFYKKASSILTQELNEQILEDGAHFELSPMYHQIMLHRVLDCISLIDQNKWKNDHLKDLLLEKAQKMLAWLSTITFKNGDIPMLNDSAYEIAPSSQTLFDYASSLNLEWKEEINLKDSGYRVFKKNHIECLMDVGEVGPKYQPGHAHSDTLNFILYYNQQPIVLEVGTSTYEKNELRQKERSTCSHNVVQVADFEQTEVWGGFRVGRRATSRVIQDTPTKLVAKHDGYKRLGVEHQRCFELNQDKLLIEDMMIGRLKKEAMIKAYFHLSPNFIPIVHNNTIKDKNSNVNIVFDHFIDIKLENYNLAHGFNNTVVSKKIVVSFKDKLKTTFNF